MKKWDIKNYRDTAISDRDFLYFLSIDPFLCFTTNYIYRAGHKPGCSKREDLEKALDWAEYLMEREFGDENYLFPDAMHNVENVAKNWGLNDRLTNVLISISNFSFGSERSDYENLKSIIDNLKKEIEECKE